MRWSGWPRTREPGISDHHGSGGPGVHRIDDPVARRVRRGSGGREAPGGRQPRTAGCSGGHTCAGDRVYPARARIAVSTAEPSCHWGGQEVWPNPLAAAVRLEFRTIKGNLFWAFAAIAGAGPRII